MSEPDTEEAWRSARALNGLPDTSAGRDAFYHGARHALNVVLDTATDGDDDALIKFNDRLRAFAMATLSGRQTKGAI